MVWKRFKFSQTTLNTNKKGTATTRRDAPITTQKTTVRNTAHRVISSRRAYQPWGDDLTFKQGRVK